MDPGQEDFSEFAKLEKLMPEVWKYFYINILFIMKKALRSWIENKAPFIFMGNAAANARVFHAFPA